MTIYCQHLPMQPLGRLILLSDESSMMIRFYCDVCGNIIDLPRNLVEVPARSLRVPLPPPKPVVPKKQEWSLNFGKKKNMEEEDYGFY